MNEPSEIVPGTQLKAIHERPFAATSVEEWMRSWMRALNPAFTNPPIFISKADAVVSWSPKAGCSHAIFWAFLHEGLLAEAASQGHLPHKYRSNVYQKKLKYRWDVFRTLMLRSSAKILIKITRDPKERLVSVFRHCCRNPSIYKESARRLDFDPSVEGISLSDLDRLLGTLDLTYPTRADPHLMVQTNPLWQLPFDRIVTLNIDEYPLNAGLNAIEGELGLPITVFAQNPVFRKLRRLHNARPRAYSKDTPIESYRFKRGDAENFPKSDLIRSPLLERMSQEYYGVDYRFTKSGDTSGVLFQADDRQS